MIFFSRKISSDLWRKGITFKRFLSSAHPKQINSSERRLISVPLHKVVGLTGISLLVGYTAGSFKSGNHKDDTLNRVLPPGVPRGCCSCEESLSAPHLNLSKEHLELPAKLAKLVGKDNVILGLQEDSHNTKYLKGARLGRGSALAIVSPTSLQDAVKVLQLIVDAGCVCIPQGQNTGLTGGSVPRDGYDRPSVILSMRNLDTMFPIDNGERVVCLAGAGIASLANNLPQWGFPNRESHSTLGSTFLNPTTAAGVAFGSGGTQLRKGPAYTDRALYAKVFQDKWGKNIVEIVNTLGIDGIEDTDFVDKSVGSAIEQLDIYAHDVKTGYTRPMASSSNSKQGKAMASAREYPDHVCKCNHNEEGNAVARSNSDTKGIECNRSEGKVLILATVHDTFPKAIKSKSYWISFEDFQTAQLFRKEVCLNNPKDLPISVEYMDRDSFDVIDSSGRIMGNIIRVIGMGSFISLLWNVKLKIEALPFDGAETFCDKFLYRVNNLAPCVLPSRMMDAGKKMDHHITMTIGDFGGDELNRILERMADFEKRHNGKLNIIECENDREEMSLIAFRFVAAPAFRTWCVGENVQGISVDYALPKNCSLTPSIGTGQNDTVPLKRMRYSHFGCNVVHEDLAFPLGIDVNEAKYALKKRVENDFGGKLPAEHGFGTEYIPPNGTKKRWQEMDPLNVMNPGIGGLSSKYKYA
jgi:D-lactate dehydrogenase (quinone)